MRKYTEVEFTKKSLTFLFQVDQVEVQECISLLWLTGWEENVYSFLQVKKMQYSMIVQGKSTNGTFEWINPYKFRNPFITSMSVLFNPIPGESLFNNVDIMNVVTNSNGEEVTISPGYYSLSQIIVILNTMNNTTFYKL